MIESQLVPTLPPSWYFSETQFLAEKEHIFKKEWLFLCHAQELPQPGDYITCDVMGIPILALRDDQGQLQVLLNVCRHRGAPLLTEKRGRLTRPVLMCQYHGWCYQTDGNFKHAPYVTAPTENLNLCKINHINVRGMIFISMSQQPSSFQTREDALLNEIDAAQFKIENYHYHSQIIREGNFNWKTWVEGFQECYHCPTIHPIFNKDFNLSKYEVHNKDHFSVHQCPRKEKSSSGSFEGLWLWIYPNCGLPCYEKIFYTKRVNPVTPGKTQLIYTFFTNEQFTKEDEKQFFDFITKITDEDFIICERAQRNLEEASGQGLYHHGYLNLARENGVYYFHELVRAAVTRETDFRVVSNI